MNRPYSVLASCYDRLNAAVNYREYADYLAEQLRRYGITDGSLVLDLACGTGNITLALAAHGYDMIGVDLSPEMLDAARRKAPGQDILWLCQDMRRFELYGTVAATVCCLDSLNYLTGRAGLQKCFSLVHNYLDPNGLFLFDMNTPYKFEHVYGTQQYLLEGKGVFCGWQNYYDKASGLCDFELTIFSENEDGTYTRFDESQRERCWSLKTIQSLLASTGFTLLSMQGDLDGSPVTETTERAYFICRANK